MNGVNGRPLDKVKYTNHSLSNNGSRTTDSRGVEMQGRFLTGEEKIERCSGNRVRRSKVSKRDVANIDWPICRHYR